METTKEATLLRIFIGESDKLHHIPLFEAIMKEAKAAGLAGATAWRGLMGFGRDTPIRTAKILDLAADLPVIIEIADDEAKIKAFRPVLARLFEESGSSGMVTLERVHISRFAPVQH